ncbi:MAG: exo-alpha-sialidase [Bacteroidota bacterium]|nr:exo-alpha-sialidase [Bacteroidota bacterium]
MKRFFTLAILLVSSCVFGQTFTTPIQVNMGGSGLADRSPMMRLDRSGNIFIAWVRGADGSQNGPIAMSVSSDGGSTFSMPVVVCSDANCNSNFQRTAQFVLDTKGNIHLVWMGNRVNKQPDIWYTRSIDKGKTWSTPISVCDADDSSKYAQDFPSIACDSSDNLYVSFLDSREVQRDSKNGHVQLYFTRSLDGGMSWSKNMKADILPGGMGGTCECCTERIAASSDGHLYIAFRSNINNLRDIWLARSNDKGLTFEPALKLSSGDWHVDACPVSGPNLALDADEGAHIVWRDVRDDSMGVSHVYYAYVPKGSAETPVNTAFDAPGASLANYADISLYGNNRVITYQTSNYGTRYLLYSGSKTVVNNRPIPSGSFQEFPTVLFAADGTRYLSWQDAKNDNGDIYFCKETSALVTASVDAEKSATKFAVYPNPISTEKSVISISYSISTPGIMRITDLLGREVSSVRLNPTLKEYTLTLPSLASGNYFCSLEGDGMILVRRIVIGSW